MILKDTDGRETDLAELGLLRLGAAPADQVRIDREMRNIEKGGAGERSAAHFINREFGNSPRMAILHDLRLQLAGDVAQIDHLVIHRFQQAAWVLETKNFAGRLSCDEHGDWTLWKGRTPVSIPSPINQARRQVILLKEWLKANRVSTIRTVEPVVLISPTSSINRAHLGPNDHVVKSDNFGQWWRKRTDEKVGVVAAFGMLGRHLVDGMSEDDLRALGATLCEAHTPLRRDWEKTLRLSRSMEKPEQASELPRIIETRLGNVTITRLPDGRLALRNDPNHELIEVVRASCKGHARWNPRFRNWVFDETSLPQVLGSLSKLLPE